MCCGSKKVRKHCPTGCWPTGSTWVQGVVAGGDSSYKTPRRAFHFLPTGHENKEVKSWGHAHHGHMSDPRAQRFLKCPPSPPVISDVIQGVPWPWLRLFFHQLIIHLPNWLLLKSSDLRGGNTSGWAGSVSTESQRSRLKRVNLDRSFCSTAPQQAPPTTSAKWQKEICF